MGPFLAIFLANFQQHRRQKSSIQIILLLPELLDRSPTHPPTTLFLPINELIHMATALREITNEIRSSEEITAKKETPKWNGTHLKFDEEGRIEAVIHEVTQPVIDQESRDDQERDGEGEREQVDENEESEREDEDANKENEESKLELWSYREPESHRNQHWQGTHIVFADEDDDANTEEEKEEESSPEVDEILRDLDQLRTVEVSQQ